MKPLNFQTLLAKSLPDDGQQEWHATLVGHTTSVFRAARVLVEELGETIVENLALQEFSIERFTATVKLGAYLHDFGKANEHFQVMIRPKNPERCQEDKGRRAQRIFQSRWEEIGELQLIRHEIVSGLLACGIPELRTWLEQCPHADFYAAVWAALGHHLKVGGVRGNETNQITELREACKASELLVYTAHPNFANLLKMGVGALHLPTTVPELADQIWERGQLHAFLTKLREEFIEVECSGDMTDSRRRFIAAVKATVTAADIAGSALPNETDETGKALNIEKWTRRVLQLVLTEQNLTKLVENRLKGQPLRPFQEAIANATNRVTLVRAGCGTGKTVAAYAWGRRYAVGKKMFFGYPTTGTASQGFFDYAAENPFEAELMHSRSAVDQELKTVLFTNEEDHEQSTDDGKDAESRDARLSSFQAWQNRLVVCTVDTILGLLQNNRKPLYSWPALCQSAFVFDEVHAYDPLLFGALLKFLETFRKAPVLLMSASFTEGQIKALKDVVESKLSEKLEEIPGPQNLEDVERYEIRRIDDLDDAWAQVEQALINREKVLWVTNIVSDSRHKKHGAIDIYRKAKERFAKLGILPLIYHSRFRYVDRIKKHRAVVDAFNPKHPGPVLAITTQVCEMSLDLSADLLITAQAPAAALIQRLGRLNRKIKENPNGTVETVSGKICPAYVYPWKSDYPYREEDLATGDVFLSRLPVGPIKQSHLAEAAKGLHSEQPEPVASSWLDRAWRSYPSALRQGGHTLTVLLEQDLPAIRKAVTKTNPLSVEVQKWFIPVTLRDSSVHWKREKVYPIAPKELIAYDPETGAEEICQPNQKSNSTFLIL